MTRIIKSSRLCGYLKVSNVRQSSEDLIEAPSSRTSIKKLVPRQESTVINTPVQSSTYSQ